MKPVPVGARVFLSLVVLWCAMIVWPLLSGACNFASVVTFCVMGGWTVKGIAEEEG